MFQYLLVVASTLIYFRVFHFPSNPKPPKSDKNTQTDPWFPLAVLDLMNTDSDSGYNSDSSSLFFECVSDSDGPTLELAPMIRQIAHGLKGNQHGKSKVLVK